ncbi:best DB hits: PFAM: PF00639 [Algibacter lectus]|uniref:Best DB hits: PFAM: PF00639 n=1 Tax=Algibacter lectus TaxID=221126 RepID=A0A090WS88_9FLAO|nr:hypothetical protein [Algibacter lectus]GAL79078.1 best DB hits: PFAM: PF00639 [Algibacter lectus]
MYNSSPPQLRTLKKKDVGLPNVDDATERQKRDGMCWKNEDELYNDGGAFKITCRDDRGGCCYHYSR